ncbi:MAG: hypothetical protein QOH70_956 [Blastocatellia bacterium]|nr:hypothetical protein [Blastocatellia bacterium]
MRQVLSTERWLDHYQGLSGWPARDPPAGILRSEGDWFYGAWVVRGLGDAWSFCQQLSFGIKENDGDYGSPGRSLSSSNSSRAENSDGRRNGSEADAASCSLNSWNDAAP